MTVRIYKSTDTGAPTLSGTAGDLTTLLDAILVNGYNSNNPPGAGWSIPSLGGTNPGTNVRVYRQGGSGHQYYYRVNDSNARVGTRDEAVGSPTAKEARIRGYEIMDTLTDPTVPHHIFPTVAQQASGLFVRKSVSADAVTRPWIALADQHTCMLFILTGDTGSIRVGYYFGDYYSFIANDPGGAYLAARITENSATMTVSVDTFGYLSSIAGNSNGDYTNRDETQAADTPQIVQKVGDGPLNVASAANMDWVGTIKYTNPADNRFYMSPVRVCNTSPDKVVRGRLRGLWHGVHPLAAVSHGDTFSGAGDLAGRSFMIVSPTPSGLGYWVVETSDTWDTN